MSAEQLPEMSVRNGIQKKNNGTRLPAGVAAGSAEEGKSPERRLKQETGERLQFRHLSQKYELVLLSAEAGKIAERMLPGTMWSMRRLSVLFFFKKKELTSVELENIRKGFKRIVDLGTAFAEELERMKKLISDNGLMNLLDNTAASGGYRRSLQIKTPMEKELAVCLGSFDRLMIIYEFFWINSFFNAMTCQKRITLLKNRMTDACAQILAIRHRLDSGSGKNGAGMQTAGTES